ncbi:MAG: T9SS type A sorting domain-containing protein [Melioribacteraceae bacterium]|nr:T9SS type A sorting domain-containing protein [Melioribacteraceae bacterium]
MKISMLIAFFIFVCNLVIAQSFTFEPVETELSGEVGSEFVFEFTITNESTDRLTVYILRTENNLPEGWYSSFCFDFCFASYIDSVATDETFGTTPLSPGESREFTVHVTALDIEGTATVSVLAANLNDPADHFNFDLTANAYLTDVNDEGKVLEEFRLLQNYPNPFNPSTKIGFYIDKPGYTNITLFDIMGNEIAVLFNDDLSIGYHEIDFDAENLASGVYIYRLHNNGRYLIQKMILEK